MRESAQRRIRLAIRSARSVRAASLLVRPVQSRPIRRDAAVRIGPRRILMAERAGEQRRETRLDGPGNPPLGPSGGRSACCPARSPVTSALSSVGEEGIATISERPRRAGRRATRPKGSVAITPYARAAPNGISGPP